MNETAVASNTSAANAAAAMASLAIAKHDDAYAAYAADRSAVNREKCLAAYTAASIACAASKAAI